MRRLAYVLSLVFFAAGQPCCAGTDRQRQGSAWLDVEFDAPTPKIALADVVTVTLTVEGPIALHPPVAPLKLPTAAPWDLVEPALRTRENLDAARIRYRIVYRFAPRAAGKKIAFHFPDIKLREGEAEIQILSWKPVFFDIATQIAVPDRSALRDITEIEEIPPVPPADWRWLWWSIALGSMALAAAATFVVRSWARRPIMRSPAQMALYELNRLIAMKLPENGRSERFITLLTLLLRQFLERQFSLQARRQTTPELLRLIEAFPHLTPSDKQFLIGFLDRCDTVKFGQSPMTPAECDRWAQAVRDFLSAHSPEPEA